MLKLTNYLHVKTIDVFLTTIFKVGLLPYLILTITSMKRNTLIKHKEAVIICEENGLVNLNYNSLLTTLEANTIVQPTVVVVIVKSPSTCTNCGKTNHTLETCHNMKREVPLAPIATIKSTKLMA
jgi:hypothetical protein